MELSIQDFTGPLSSSGHTLGGGRLGPRAGTVGGSADGWESSCVTCMDGRP